MNKKIIVGISFFIFGFISPYAVVLANHLNDTFIIPMILLALFIIITIFAYKVYEIKWFKRSFYNSKYGFQIIWPSWVGMILGAMSCALLGFF